MHLSISNYVRIVLTPCLGLFLSLLVRVSVAAGPTLPTTLVAPAPPTLTTSTSVGCGIPVSVTAFCSTGTVSFVGSGGAAAGNIYTFSVPGNYTLSATCADGTGVSTAATPVAVSVKEANLPPVLTPSATTVLQGSPTVSITAVGCAGGIIQYFGSAGVSTIAPGGTISMPTSTTGTKVISALCSRNGCISDVSVATILVRPAVPPSSLPTVVTPIPSQTAVAGTTFTYLIPFNTFSDPNGDLLTLTASGLPGGLFFNGSLLNGPLAAAGTSQITITATNSLGGSVSTTFSLVVLPAATLVSSGTLTCASPSVTITASGGTNYVFSPGATQIGSSAAAVVTTMGVYSVTATGPNGYKSIAATNVSADVNSCNLQLIAPLYNCTTGAFYFRTIGGDGSPITYFAIGITGNTSVAGPYTVLPASDAGPFTLIARQGNQTATYTWDWKAFCLASNVPPTTTGLSNKTAVVGQLFVYNTSPSFIDSNSDPLSFSATGLPAGVNITPQGIISGTPSVTGVSTVTVTATDIRGLSTTASFGLTVLPVGSPVTPPGPLSLSAVVTSCTPGLLTINLVANGGNGSAYEYFGIGVTGWTPSPGPFQIAVFSDTGPVTLFVRNSNNPAGTVSYTLQIPECARPSATTTTQPPSNTGVGQSLTITAASINCATRQISLTTIGGDNSPILKRILLVTTFIENAQPLVLDEGVFLEANQTTIQLQVSQNGVTSALFSYNFRAQCPLTPPPSNTTTTPTGVTACGQVYTPGNQPLSLSATFTCNTGSIPHVINFIPSGGVNENGTVIEFLSLGITGWTPNCQANLDLGQDQSQPDRTYTIMARQRNVITGAIVAMATRNVVETCPNKAGAREAIGTKELDVTVLGNPTLSDKIEVEVRGAEGQPLVFRVNDMQGRSLHTHSIERAGSAERQGVQLGQGAGVYFIQVSTPGNTKTIRVVRQ